MQDDTVEIVQLHRARDREVVAVSRPQIENLDAMPAQPLPESNILANRHDAVRIEEAHQQKALAVLAAHDTEPRLQFKVSHSIFLGQQ